VPGCYHGAWHTSKRRNERATEEGLKRCTKLGRRREEKRKRIRYEKIRKKEDKTRRSR